MGRDTTYDLVDEMRLQEHRTGFLFKQFYQPQTDKISKHYMGNVEKCASQFEEKIKKDLEAALARANVRQN